jgi:penicillin-insensitive murein endopeptidase
VIFDPKLAGSLYKTSYGYYLKEKITIPLKKSWVRHDEHYHVDFALACRPL